ncbi:type 1 glutamine amidotransferase [Halobellus sp. EA9]|uniref:type 1 glutamine amidotransferase n=1 Tax=Halobellus sp. EA9 TaxID=3421647 RepID=UPI003EBB42B0
MALLNAAQLAEPTRRNFRRVLDADLTAFHAPSGELPGTLRYDGVVITGSWASVYWDREWIGRLKAWIGGAVEAGVPTLGVCYGHQLLADVLGGRVASMDGCELGYRTVEQDGENRLLDGLDETFTVFTSHSDRVVEAPPGATVFARNDYGIHGFRRDCVFGVQFHPEYDPEMAERVTRRKDDKLPDERIRSVLDGITPANYAAAREATRLFDNFTEYVLDASRRPE